MHATNTTMPRSVAAPIYDHAARIVRVPLAGRPGFAVMDLEDFETLSQRQDIVMSPLRLGLHHREPAVRVKYREQSQDGLTVTQPAADFVLRPPLGCRIVCKDGDPLNLRRSNLAAVPMAPRTAA